MKSLISAFFGLFVVSVAVADDNQTNFNQSKPSEVIAAMDEKPKRGAPKPVLPLEVNGIRYEVVRGGKARGHKQDGGVIAAIDVATSRELWTLTVYHTIYDGNEEKDVQERYITKLAVDPDSQTLRVENEANKVFLINLKTREITELSGQ